VKPTRHFASREGGFRVDYYALLTGDCEPITIKNPRDESVDLSFFQLKNPRRVISCADCLSRPEIQKQIADLFSAVP
jgi:hypothetical protein